MILALLYGLKNLDFFDFINSLTTIGVHPFLILFILLIPIFIFAEKRAISPVISLSYFTNRNILITLILSTLSGFIMMGVIFVPQFSENCLNLKTGSGGYLVIILGLFAGLGSPMSGKMIDKFGPKVILGLGFICNMVGSLFMIFVTINYPNMLTVLIGLALMGLGTGFTIGTPINYMMLADTDPKDSNSALATVSLVRSIGTAVAPAIMIGFISSAGMNVQNNIMDELPKTITLSGLPYQKEISNEINQMKKIPGTEKMSKELSSLQEILDNGINMDMKNNSNSIKLPKETIEMLQTSDVTTIVNSTKEMTKVIFDLIEDNVTSQICSGIDKGTKNIDISVKAMKKVDNNSKQIASMEKLSLQMKEMNKVFPSVFHKSLDNYIKEIDNNSNKIEKTFQETLNKGFMNIYILITITSLLALGILSLYHFKKINLYKN